jgi:hypothetical protein
MSLLCTAYSHWPTFIHWPTTMAWLALKKNYEHAIESLPETLLPRPMSLTNVDLYKKAALNTSMDQETKDVFGAFLKRTLLREAPDLSSTVTADICEDCGVQMMVIANDSMLACSRCAKTRVITSANAWTAAMDVDFSTSNNHQKSRLLEWLEFAQAKEYGEIADDTIKIVMEAIVSSKSSGLEKYISEIAEERQKNGPYLDSSSAIERLKHKVPSIESLLKNLDGIMVRNVIRSTSAKKFGERSPKIASMLSGFWPERLTADQEEYVRKLFMAASPAYDKWRKTNQPVWPGGYAYFLRCLMILLGWDEFATMFPIQMTGRNQEREDMRAAIWANLRWELVPSSGPQRPIKMPGTVGSGSAVLDGSLISAADAKCKFSARGYDEL